MHMCGADVGRQPLDAGLRGRGPDDVPEHLRRRPVAPDAAGLIDRPKDGALGDGGGPAVSCKRLSVRIVRELRDGDEAVGGTELVGHKDASANSAMMPPRFGIVRWSHPGFGATDSRRTGRRPAF